MTAKNSFSVFYLLLALCPLFVFTSCSSSKDSVIMVETPTVSSAKTDTLITFQDTTTTGARFQAITIGENQPIYSLDPLFARTMSEMQAIQLVYEGLVRFNSQGEIVPAIAKSWQVSNNHREYRFTLKNNIYYQNSSIFSSGRGRKLRPGDIKKDFERMAHTGVPVAAADLFMNIRGFEPYFQEQHNVFRSSERQFRGVSGIKIPNDSTIVFKLVQPDQHFLQKLASPYAVIYPLRAAQENHFEAVGTGPFKFSAQRADSIYIFARSESYHEDNQPKLNRVNIITSRHSNVLLNLMQQGYIDLIPALGPKQMAAVSQKGGGLEQSFFQNYLLLKPAGRVALFKVQYNPDANQPESGVVNALSPFLGTPFFSEPPLNSVHLQWSFPNVSSSELSDTLSASYTDDPFIRAFYTMLKTKLTKRNITFNMKQTRVINRTIPLHAFRMFILFGSSQPVSQILANFKVDVWALAGKYVNNLSFNRYPWWINLRGVTVTKTFNR